MPIKAKRRTGSACFIRRGKRLPLFHRSGPGEHSFQTLATKTRMGRQIVGWWRRPQARKEHSSPTLPEPRRVDTKPLTTDAPLTEWGTWQGIGLSDRGDLELAPPGWFGHGLLTRPSSATAVSDRRRATWRPTVGRTAGSGDPRPTETLAQPNKFAAKAVGIRGRSRPTLQHATLTLPPVYDL